MTTHAPHTRSPDTMQEKNAGFTLIELIIVVAIVAILATVAYTFYGRHLETVRRGNVEADLTELSNSLEQYHSNNGSYKDASVPFDVSPRDAKGDDVYYKIKLSTDDDGQSYTLTAQPVNAQSDDSCGVLSIDQTGTTTAEGDDCW